MLRKIIGRPKSSNKKRKAQDLALPKSLWGFYFKYAICGSRKVIAIAHRLSTLRNMDRIVVLKDGHIIEQGTHAQLLRKRGEYARLWKMQSGGFLQD